MAVFPEGQGVRCSLLKGTRVPRHRVCFPSTGLRQWCAGTDEDGNHARVGRRFRESRPSLVSLRPCVRWTASLRCSCAAWKATMGASCSAQAALLRAHARCFPGLRAGAAPGGRASAPGADGSGSAVGAGSDLSVDVDVGSSKVGTSRVGSSRVGSSRHNTSPLPEVADVPMLSATAAAPVVRTPRKRGRADTSGKARACDTGSGRAGTVVLWGSR